MTKVALPATLTRLEEALANLDLGDIKAAKRQIEIIRALVLSEMDVETRREQLKRQVTAMQLIRHF